MNASSAHRERRSTPARGKPGTVQPFQSEEGGCVEEEHFFFLMQSFAFSVGAAFCKQKRSEPRSNKHFEGFLWVGFQRSCRIKTFSDNWVNISSSLSQRYLEKRRFHFPLRKTKIFCHQLTRKPINAQLMRIQHKDSYTNRLISGALPKEEWCVCVCVCQFLRVYSICKHVNMR